MPDASVAVDCTFAPVPCASTVTPGRAPPVSSLTVPFTACADAAAAKKKWPNQPEEACPVHRSEISTLEKWMWTWGGRLLQSRGGESWF
jgi:hypothetical protein